VSSSSSSADSSLSTAVASPSNDAGAGGPQQGGDALGDPWPHPIQRRDRMAPEPHRVVVGGVQRQPAHEPLASLAPVSQERRLAEPSGRGDQRQLPRQPVIEAVHQPRAGHETPRRSRQMELGCQQLVRPAGGRVLGRPVGCVSHRAPPAHRRSYYLRPRARRWRRAEDAPGKALVGDASSSPTLLARAL
jgi:hypothetical protein